MVDWLGQSCCLAVGTVQCDPTRSCSTDWMIVGLWAGCCEAGGLVLIDHATLCNLAMESSTFCTRDVQGGSNVLHSILQFLWRTRFTYDATDSVFANCALKFWTSSAGCYVSLVMSSSCFWMSLTVSSTLGVRWTSLNAAQRVGTYGTWPELSQSGGGQVSLWVPVCELSLQVCYFLWVVARPQYCPYKLWVLVFPCYHLLRQLEVFLYFFIVDAGYV